MEAITYDLVFDPIDISAIESDFYSNNRIYCNIEKTPDGDHIYVFNPEYAFEKQQIVNADAGRILRYLHIPEKYPELYQKFLQIGHMYIRTDHANISVFLIHSLPSGVTH
ncbi:hypothetical protein [Xanthocytophaga agilis]|uniref:Uncharacterized protein n=1 Tax=Xanthocytophaga agilis TaxID=3048010 RepID=A0AAE3R6W8_9BACT|nr:hypothetical protein [Xanthocytophaga agilis]MDJ1502564.1 hypothetical protein [Xanthocytophaga agilis]